MREQINIGAELWVKLLGSKLYKIYVVTRGARMVGVVVEQRTLCIQVERSAGARVRVYVARVCAEHRRTWWLSAHCGSTGTTNDIMVTYYTIQIIIL